MEYILDVSSFLENITQILRKVLYNDIISIPITLDTELVNGVGSNNLDMSSIDYVDFLAIVEKEYDFVYDFDSQIYTVGDIYNYIISYKKKKSGVEL